MIRIITPLLLGAVLSIMALPASASELSGHATLTSQYIYRGIKMTDDNAAIQLGLDYQHDSGWFAGAWATTVDLNSNFGQRDVELDYYAGYALAGESDWSATLTLLRYTYPGASGLHGYDHNELLLGAAWKDRFFVEVGYTDDLYGLDWVGKYWAVRGEWPLGDVWVVGAGLGGNDFSAAGTAHFTHWDFGATARVSRFSIDFRYFDRQDPDGFIVAQRASSAQFAASISTDF